MCRTVEDIAIALGSLTGVDSTDTKTLASAGHFETDYTKYLDENALKGKRIGLLKASMGFHYKVDSLMHQAVSFMKSQGAEVIELDFDLPASVTNASFQVLLFEFKDGLNRYFKGLGDQAPVKSLEELIRFNASDSVELKYFDQHLLELAQAKGGTDTRGYKEALALMLKGSREEGIDMLMDKYRLDALVLPTGSPAWKTDLVNGDHYIGGNSSLAAIAGYPGISVPMGFIGGLPVGVSFVGRAWSEPLLIGLAYAFEQGTKARKPPEYLYTD
jgi:amidase